MNYRTDARNSLKRAENFLSNENDQNLKYAALELRMTMEALTYERALAYKDEFPPKEYETWQPRKVMLVLLDIDPTADKDCSLAAGLEEEYGVPAPKMTFFGSEKILNMATLRKHYDALGSFLHVQSMKQVRAGKPLNFIKMRSRCETIAAFVREVLSSTVFNVTFGSFATLQCLECRKPIRRRIPRGQDEVFVDCYECVASYRIVQKEDDKVAWIPHQHDVKCANSECEHNINLWHREVEIGKYWVCPDCKGQNLFVISVHHEPKGHVVDAG